MSKSKNTQFFILKDKDTCANMDMYIFAQVSANKYCLISLMDGNRWNDPVEVKDHMALSKEETKAIFSHSDSVFWEPVEFANVILDKINGYK